MNISLGERLVNIEIDNLRRKLRGNGGRNLGPRDKVAEINSTLARINRIRRDQKLDKFFSTRVFKNIVRWLENISITGD